MSFLSQSSVHLAKQLLLQDELALLILLGALEGLVVLPPNNLFALPTGDVAHGVLAGGHVAIARVGGLDVHDDVEEVGFAVLAAEVLRMDKLLVCCRSCAQCSVGECMAETYPADDLIVVGKVSLAVLAAVDALGVEVHVVGEAHLESRMGLPGREVWECL